MNFVKTGNPNGEDLSFWPPFNLDDPMVMELGDQVQAIKPPHLEQIQFMQEIYYK
ncbi:hypothetical protein AAGF08_04805 [Algoriphagus sp. SE2]|uniref:hypothetical protein n=1 Tax=Algoriphagus sp. SE2 TaxID=3141536 RepID=UPI0031CD33B3